jgi:hypothetical protein
MGRACSTHGSEEEYISNFGRKARKKQLGKPRSKWEDNIKADLTEKGWIGMD